MVTREQVQETTSPPVEDEAPVQPVADDEPLIPPDPPDEEMVVPRDEVEAPEAAPDEAESEAREDEAAEPPLAETEEESADEEPDLEARIAAAVEERLKPLRDTWQGRQRADQERIRQLRAERQESAVNERVEARRRDLTQWFADRGISAEDAEEQIRQGVDAERANITTEQERAESTTREATRLRTIGKFGLDRWVEKLVTDNTLNDTDRDFLSGYYDAETLPLLQNQQTGELLLDQDRTVDLMARLDQMAQRLSGTAEATRSASESTEAAARAVQARTPHVPLETPEATSVETDDAFLRRYADPDDPESNTARAREILRRRGQHP